MHRRPEFAEQKPDPGLIKPAAGPSPIDRNDNRNHNHHHAPTTNDQPSKPELVAQQPPGPNAAVNNRSIQPNATTNTAWREKNAAQQNSSRPTPNAGNVPTNVYRPPPRNQSTNAPPTAPKQQPQQPAAKPDTTEPNTTSMDIDYMAGEDMTFFESEDEKWMMGDFDIDLDVDLGRPIDFEADESAANRDDSGFLDADSSGNVDTRKGTPSGPVSSVSAQRNPAVSVSGHNNNNVTNSGLGSSTNGNNNSAQRSGGSNPVRPTSSTGVNPNGNDNNGSGNKEVSFQPLPNVRPGGNGTSNGNGNNRGQPLNGSNGNGNNGNGGGGRTNLSNSTSAVQPSGSGNGRPSAGGFSFPPGVVRCVFDLSIRDHNHNQNQNQSGIGLKRPAESMLQHPQQQ